MLDMPKLHSPFVRDHIDGAYVVTDEITEGYDWVFDCEDVVAVEKLNGCLGYTTTVETDEGFIQIGVIVNQRLPVNILSYNEITGETEYKPIVHYHKERNVDGYFCINVKQRGHGTRPKNLIVTPNHKFMTPIGWKRADELVVDENVMVLVKNLDFVRKQLILGTLLGDSSVIWGEGKKNCGISGSHIIKQSEYFDLKMELMGNLFTEGKGAIGGFPGSTPNRKYHSIITTYTSEFIQSRCLINDDKVVNNEWIKELTPIAIAFWYMDDGSLIHNSKQYQRDRMTFATHGFVLEEVELLQSKLLDSWNISSTIQHSDTSNGHVLVISANGTETLSNLVAPYMIQSMRYKLPEIYRSGSCYWDDYVSPPTEMLLETPIIKIDSDYTEKVSNHVYQYDISVEDNSNYFIGNTLVHNTNVSVLVNQGMVQGIWNRTAQVPFINKGKQFIIEGIQNAFERGWLKELFDGQHFGELIGGKVAKNPHNVPAHLFVPFNRLMKTCTMRSWHWFLHEPAEISDWMRNLETMFGKKYGSEYLEGVVFYNPDGRMAKLRCDMYPWFTEKRH